MAGRRFRRAITNRFERGARHGRQAAMANGAAFKSSGVHAPQMTWLA